MPAAVEADAVGTKLTTSGWITFTVVKPVPPTTTVPEIMTPIFALLLLVLVGYAYLKRR